MKAQIDDRVRVEVAGRVSISGCQQQAAPVIFRPLVHVFPHLSVAVGCFSSYTKQQQAIKDVQIQG
jgi:hypothetical protein